ncbi:MAG: 6-carboxytetrahydropterin synthase [Phycisphaerales bacterium]|nr:6-carboxytetrahydropterin synthase [Phycisphaerales bacterium]
MASLDHPIMLSRSVRILVGSGQPDMTTSPNSFAAVLATNRLGAFYEFTMHCEGPLEARTGFVENIYEVDRAVQAILGPRLADGLQHGDTDPVILLRDSMGPLSEHLDSRLVGVDWSLSPTYRISMETADMSTVILSQQYQFAASHRLYNPDLDEPTNRSLFGKCCNANGHGHNYRLEVEVEVPVDAAEPRFSVLDLDSIVHDTVVDRYDHTYLNMDVDEFQTCNPTVENITITCHDRLAEPLASAGARLRRVRLWETEKTCCTYPATTD